jgi:hypothetical protein
VRLRSPLLALVGLLALGAVGLRLLDGRLSVAQGAMRIVIVLAVLLAVERVVLPLCRALVGGPREREVVEATPVAVVPPGSAGGP